jgi:predicted metal-dependent phosphoesterase TrpH
MKIKILLSIITMFGTVALAQNPNNEQFPAMQKVPMRQEIRIPGILGYQTLKCDFHMHTVFSDGIVWPTFRVEEAWQEGLDAIAITDHIENQPSKKYVAGDHNASYELAIELAKQKDILLIHAGEITREMPPGHLNALFLTDTNPLDVTLAEDALQAAKNQGAFIIWNHPGWKAQQPDTCKWWPMHEKLFEKGLINGIEVFNETEFYPIVLDWCITRNISVIGNSDIHGITSETYDLERDHRPMTLVFAKSRTVESIREAMFNNRTVAYFDGKLAGREEFLKALFFASVSVKPTGTYERKNRELFEITNISTIPFEIETQKGERFIIPLEASIIMPLVRGELSGITVRNLYTGSGTKLHVNLF